MRACPYTVGVRGTTGNGRDARAWQAAFLLALRRKPNITAACERAGIARKTAYAARAADEAFRERWDEALARAIDAVEEAGIRAARGGKNAAPDASLVKFFLSRWRPERYSSAPRQPVIVVAVHGQAPREIGALEDVRTLTDEELGALAAGDIEVSYRQTRPDRLLTEGSTPAEETE